MPTSFPAEGCGSSSVKGLVRQKGWFPMTTEAKNGLIELRSNYSAAETMARVEAAVRQAGHRIFARIDHAAAASESGLKMPFAQVLVFGNPKGGTPMMLAAPTLAIDLPFKVLVWEDASGQTHLAYNSPDYLLGRHGAPQSFAAGLNRLAALVESALR